MTARGAKGARHYGVSADAIGPGWTDRPRWRSPNPLILSAVGKLAADYRPPRRDRGRRRRRTRAPAKRLSGPAQAATAGAIVWLAGNPGGLVVALVVQALVHHPTAAFLAMAALSLPALWMAECFRPPPAATIS